MPNTIQIKRRTSAGLPSGLAAGELAVNLSDNKLYVGNAAEDGVIHLNPSASTSYLPLDGGILTNTSQPVLKTAYNADHYLGIGHHYIDLNFSSYTNDLELRTGGTPRLTIHRSTGNTTFSGTITATGGTLNGSLTISDANSSSDWRDLLLLQRNSADNFKITSNASNIQLGNMNGSGWLGFLAGNNIRLKILSGGDAELTGALTTGGDITISSGNAGLRLHDTTNGSNFVIFSNGSELRMAQHNATFPGAYLNLTTGGNLGLGVTGASERLEVAGNITANGKLTAKPTAQGIPGVIIGDNTSSFTAPWTSNGTDARLSFVSKNSSGGSGNEFDVNAWLGIPRWSSTGSLFLYGPNTSSGGNETAFQYNSTGWIWYVANTALLRLSPAGTLYPNSAAGVNLGASTNRWNLYATSGDFSGTATVGESVNAAGLVVKRASNGNPYIAFNKGSTRHAYIQSFNSELYLTNDNGDDIDFRTGNADNLTLGHSGNLFSTKSGTLGTSASRWSTIYGAAGNFSGHVTLAGDATGILYFGSKRALEGQITNNNLDLGEHFANIRMRSSADVFPTNSVNLGTSSNRWATIYGAAGDFSGNLSLTNSHLNLSHGYSLQWADSHERIEATNSTLKFFTNNGQQMTLSGSNLTVGGAISLSTNTTPSTAGGEAFLYKHSSNGTVLSGYNASIETGSAGSRSVALSVSNAGTVAIGDTLRVGGHTNAQSSSTISASNKIDVADITTGAFRFYSIAGFRGGLGTDRWASGISGTEVDLALYVDGDNDFNIWTNNVKRAIFNSTGLTLATQATRFTYSGAIQFRSDNQFNFLRNSDGGAQAARFNGIQVSDTYNGTPPTNGVLFGTDTQLYRSAANTLSLGSDDSLKLGNSSKIKLGDSNDLEIYHDGSHSIIHDNGTGDLHLRGNVVRIKNAAGTENMASFVQGGEVVLAHNNLTRLTTTNYGNQLEGGVRITGNHTDTGSQLNLWCDASGHARSAVYDWFFYTGGNNARTNVPLFLAHTGNVGIAGVTAPSTPLHSSGTIRVGTSTFTDYKASQQYSNGTYEVALASGSFKISDGSNNAKFTITPSTGAAVFENSLTVGGTITLASDSEHSLSKVTTSAVTGSSVETTDLRGRNIDLYAFDDINLRAGTSDTIRLFARNTTEKFTVKDEVVVNEGGEDVNFRVEGDSDSNLIVADASADRVGIGVAVPSAKLHVYRVGVLEPKFQSSNGRVGLQLTAGNTGDANWILYSGYPAAGDFTIREGGVANHIVVKKTSGSVGIGTASPAQNLHVQGTTSIVHIESSTANANASVWLKSNVGGTVADRWEIGTNISRGASLEIYDRLNTVSRLELTNGGLLGIGTGSSGPSEALHVLTSGSDNGVLFESSDNHGNLWLKAGGNYGCYIRLENAGTANYKHYINLQANGNLYFRPNATGTEGNQVVINQLGNLGVGESGPTAKLHVNASQGWNSLFTDGTNGLLITTSSSNASLVGYDGGNYNDIQIRAGTTSDTYLYLKSTGIGINTTSPDNPLEVVGADSGIKISSTSSNRPHLRLECGTAEKLRLSANTLYGAIGDSSDTNRYMVFRDGLVGIGGLTTPAATLHIEASTPEFRLATLANAVVRFRTNGDNYINTGQNLGIGTESPSEKLHVSGNVRASQYLTTTGNNRTKIKFWGTSTNYGIGMYSGMTYGGLNDYAMTFQFNDESDRGFWWGDSAHTNAQGAMALTTNGKLTVATSMRLGFGTDDTTTPGSDARLDISSNDGTDHTDSTPDTILRLRKKFFSSDDKDSAVNFDVSRYITGGNNRPRTRLDFVLSGDEGDTYDNSEPNVNVLSVRSDSRVGIGGVTSPDGTLHVHTASAGTVTADTDRDDLVIENSTNVGLTFLSPNTAKQAIAFGDPQNSRVGLITYDHADDSLAVRCNNTDNLLKVTSTGVGIGQTPSSGFKLDVSHEARIGDKLTVSSNIPGIATASGGLRLAGADGSVQCRDGSGAQNFSVWYGAASKARLDSNGDSYIMGDFGCGTSSPSGYKLYVNGTSYFNNTQTATANVHVASDANTNLHINGATHAGETWDGAIHIKNSATIGNETSNEAVIYAEGGELKCMDDDRNRTTLSSHIDGKWVYMSNNTKTGKSVKIHMEDLVKAVEEHLGVSFSEIVEGTE